MKDFIGFIGKIGFMGGGAPGPIPPNAVLSGRAYVLSGRAYVVSGA